MPSPMRLAVLLLLGARLFAQGAAETQSALDRLNVLGGVLIVGAHEDDDDTASVAYFALGRQYRTAYLSIAHGCGAQNLIGDEQGDLMGVLLQQEALAARRVYGAEQLFTRAIDFGFTKTAAEALAKWPRERILADIVWIIRRFQPDVVILCWSGTPRDGHGAHQASAILGREAYAAAADPNRFPEQLKPEQLNNVHPWKVRRLLRRAAASERGSFTLDTGGYNPLIGKSYSELAAISRSFFRSQAMGYLASPQERSSVLSVVDGEPAANDPFEGIDTSWARVEGGQAVGRILAEAARHFDPQHPDRTVPALLQARSLLRELKDQLAQRKLAELDQAIQMCCGLWLEARTLQPTVVPGTAAYVTLSAVNRSSVPIQLTAVRIEGRGHPLNVDTDAVALPANRVWSTRQQLPIPEDHPYSQPVWLQRPQSGSVAAIDDREQIGPAEGPTVAQARFRLRIGAEQIDLLTPVVYREFDPRRGEETRPLDVVPPVALQFEETAVLFPTASPRTLAIRVMANRPGVSGDVRVQLDAGWKADPAERHFDVAQIGQTAEMTFVVTPPASESICDARAIARVNGRDIKVGMRTISYPHITPRTVFPPANVRLVRSDVRVTARNVGYVAGAGDNVPRSLGQMGCRVTLLNPDDLGQRDLSEFDAVVTGVRAYDVRTDLRANRERLLDYVKNGGTLVMQYNRGEGGGSRTGIGPYPFRIGEDRVTVEEAPVALLQPDHPLLKFPNAIGPRDFEGWIQERGLYFPAEWDPKYETVIESHDPGEKPLPGGTLYTKYGKGVFIYTGYAWFRQLPAGVPGAYRLFANMISR